MPLRRNEDMVHRIQDEMLLKLLRDGSSVIVDDTHLPQKSVHDLHRVAESIGDVQVIEKVFPMTVAQAKACNATGEGLARIPDEGIDRLATRMCKPEEFVNRETYYPALTPKTSVQDESLESAV